MFKRVRIVGVILFLLLSAVAAVAQDNPSISWSLKVKQPAELKPGDTFNVQVSARIDDGWHLYSMKKQPGGRTSTALNLPRGQPFQMSGNIKAPEPLTDFDKELKAYTTFYEGSVTFTLPITVLSGVAEGWHTLKVIAIFQTCNDVQCYPEIEVPLETKITLVAGAKTDAKQGEEAEKKKQSPAAAETTGSVQPASPKSASTEQPDTGGGKENQTIVPANNADNTRPVPEDPPSPPTQFVFFDTGIDPNQSLLSFIWLAMVVGALSLLTPCVFPMVPITISYFTSHTGGSRSEAVRNAFIFCAGIIFTFTVLGMALALFAGASGINQFAANPWSNLLITAIFLAFAMNLFGAYAIGVPSGLLTRIDSLTRREGGSQIVGMLLVGLVFTLTSFTCTAPFIGTLLVMASQGNWRWPLLGMLAFSVVFALPFFLLALAPQLLARLPRSGGWLNSVKVVMGFLEVAAAMKFISNVDLVWQWGIFTREVVLASWVAIAMLIAFYLLGKFTLLHDSPPERIGAVRLMLAIVFLAACVWLLTGLFGQRLGELESFLPVAGDSVVAGRTGGSSSGELTWIVNDYEGALTRAQQEKKLVLIDFTGYTCTNCRWMEANMFPREEVKRRMERYIRVKLYTDGRGEIYKKNQEMERAMFNTVALPHYAIVDAGSRPIASFSGLTRDTARFVAFLEQDYAESALEGRVGVR